MKKIGILPALLVVLQQGTFCFDRNAVPDKTLVWTLDATAPELAPIGSPWSRANNIEDNSELRLYIKNAEVALYSPGTYQFFVVPCKNEKTAVELFNFVSLCYTYYLAEDRTHTAEDSRDMRAGELFIRYLYQADVPCYESGRSKYMQDQLTEILDYDSFVAYVNAYDVEKISLELSGFKLSHKYYRPANKEKMYERLKEIYSSESLKKWFF